MSANLYVRKKPKEVERKTLSYPLRKAFQEHSAVGSAWGDAHVTRDFLLGLAVGGVEGAQDLLDLWDDNNGELEFRIQY